MSEEKIISPRGEVLINEPDTGQIRSSKRVVREPRVDLREFSGIGI